MRMAVAPILKLKVDELFLRWLSLPDTQKVLHEDLNKLVDGRSLSPRQLSPSLSPGSLGGQRPTSPPAPPSSSPLSSRSPRSPRSTRRPLSKSPPRSPNVDKHEANSSMKESHLILNDVTFSPGCASKMPQFYFPFGRPKNHSKLNVELVLDKVSRVFDVFEEGQVTKENFGAVAKACDLPLYWREPLFAAAGGHKNGHVTYSMFAPMWKRIMSTCHDDVSKFVRLLALNEKRNYLVSEDFVSLIQDIIDTHPGLEFLREVLDFHSRYIHTVIARIFYCANSSWTGKLTIPELRRSCFLEVLAFLEEEEDINEIGEFFSYEHFYVIYCKFWELDTDHDLLVDEKDLSKHENHALSSRMIKRLFSGCVTRGGASEEGKMTYPEFVWFILSEVDKKQPRSIEYWFRCMDLDGDGVLSMYELEYFFEEQVAKMDSLGIETMSFEDCLCQMLDMVKPKVQGKITLSDLKACQMAHVFFNTFFNLDKYLEYEQRDPFAAARESQENEGVVRSDWERYAAEEYELLVAEEGNNEDNGLYDDDFEDDDLPAEDIDALSGDLGTDDVSSTERPWAMVTGIDDDDDDDDDGSSEQATDFY